MSHSSHHLPSGLEQRLGEIALQLYRRQRLRDWVRFGGAFLALLLGLGLSLKLLEGTPVPPAVPFGVFGVLLITSGVRWLYFPSKRRIDRKQIALFVDEHHPELENLVVSSVEFSRQGYAAASDWIVERVLQDSKALAGTVAVSDLSAARPSRWLAVGAACLWLAGFAVLGVFLYRWDLQRLRDGFFSGSAHGGAPFSVEPGNVRVRRGSDQVVWVTTGAPDRSGAIRWRARGGNWQSAALQPSRSDGMHYFQLQDLQEDTEYQIQVGRRRSEVYTVAVWTPPEVTSIHLTYRYPEYLGLPPREIPDGGHISAPEGTEVELDVEVNKKLSGAALMLASGGRIDLSEAASRVWRGRLAVARDDSFHIALRDPEGGGNEYRREYAIVALEDRAPEIRIRSPRGDDEATSLEEVPFAFSVGDDHGLKDYGLQYEISGREPVRLSLNRAKAAPTQADGEYLLALEGLDLSAGDFVTWTVWAEDGNPGRDPLELLGDPYFLDIRPFRRLFSEAVSNRGGENREGGRPGAANQKQVIIATWNLRKAASDLDAQEFETQRNTIARAQREVLDAALENAPRGARQQVLIAGLQQEVAAALEALEEAVPPSPQPSLSSALRHEQRAYHFMLRLEPDRAEVMQGRNSRGAGGGGAAQRELDGLELSRRRDFREEASTLKVQQAETEAARSRIAELAKRQALINEDIARLISEMESLKGDEREEARRKLKQLLDEQRRNLAALDAAGGEIASGDLDARQAQRAQQQLDGARQQMDRSAGHLGDGRLQRAQAAGNRALGALNRARDQLQGLSRNAAADRMAELREGMQEIRSLQARIAEQVRDREEQEDAPGATPLASAERETEQILRSKEGLADVFRAFMDDAGELAEKSAASQGLMSRKLGDWLRTTSRRGIHEDILKGSRYVRYGAWDAASNIEKSVEGKLAEAAERLDAVAVHLMEDELDGMEMALDQLRGLMEKAKTGRTARPGEPSVRSGRNAGGDRRPGPAYGWGPQTPDDLRDFAEKGYRDWVEAIRNAEALLPQGDATGRRLSGIREDIGVLGRRYARNGKAPQYDLVFDRAVKPLTLAAEELKKEIGRRRNEYDSAPADDGDIPEQYRVHVSDYFKALSELEEK